MRGKVIFLIFVLSLSFVVVEGKIHDFTNLPINSAGWTDFEALINSTSNYNDSRVVFVSSSLGDDATAKVYSVTNITFDSKGIFQNKSNIEPYKTITEAYKQVRDGYPDIILLKKGDTWNENQRFTSAGAGEIKSGMSNLERHIIASYGTGNRPIIYIGENTGLISRDQENIIVSGIKFSSNDSQNTERSLDILGTDSNQLYEDCVFENNTNRVQGYNGEFYNISFRRNQFLEGKIEGGVFQKTASVYSQFGKGLLFEENIFYSPIARNRHLYLSPAGGTSNTSDSYTLSGVILSKNIFFTSERTGISGRSAPDIDNNLILRNDLIIFGGHGGSEDSIQSGNILNNIFMESCPGVGDGEQGIWARNIDGGKIANNIWTDDTNLGPNSGVINIMGHTNVNIAKNIEIYNNTIYGWSGAGSSRLLSTSDSLTEVENVNIYDNDFQMIKGASSIMLHRTYANGTKQFEGFSYSGNRYYSNDSLNTWFVPGDNFTSWVNLSGETNAESIKISYTNPSRNLKSYYQSLGGTSSTEDFMLKVLTFSRDNWDTSYTACEVNNYIREGFDKEAIDCEFISIAEFCGDSTCNSNENCTTCETDCGVCQTTNQTNQTNQTNTTTTSNQTNTTTTSQTSSQSNTSSSSSSSNQNSLMATEVTSNSTSDPSSSGPKKSYVGIIVSFIALGVLIIIGTVILIFWMIRRREINNRVFKVPE